ncbi:hypothetical protein Zmor_007693 [Zophobas morio]|uniref:Uncharacterized protein n=1 Tax=Zophobas morio TaxID=2755281 RepID=A0AA38IZN5_9CUCU|nr:hypothetical protein Zmor_007693 [Zophobas morio]
MKKSETFKKRSGTTDKGKDYENITIANIVLQMVSDDKINNFQISSNDNNFGAFDDVVVKIESDENIEVKAIQLKHSDRKILSVEHLKSEKGDFSLKKYFESYLKLKNAVQEFIIYTNRPFTDVSHDAKFQLPGQNFYVRPVKMYNLPFNFEISKKVNYIYKFEIVEDAWTAEHFSEIQEYQSFFKKFSLYTNQENFDALRLSTIEMFRTTYSSSENAFDQYYKIISEWNMREGTKETLNKKWMQRAIGLQLLAPHIEPLSCGLVNDKMKIFRDAVSMFTITLIDKNSCENAKQLWGEIGKEKIDIKEINRIRINYQLSVDYIHGNAVENLNPKLLTQLLWLMNKCPLIIHENQDLEKAIQLCENDKFIVLSDGINEEWMEMYPLFKNLSNIKSKRECYDTLLRNFTVSIQGKEELNLMTAFGNNEESLDNVTTSDLMGMLNGPWSIDGKQEILSEPYIERHLSQNCIDIKYLDQVRENTIIILYYAGNFEEVKDKFYKYKIINVDLPKTEQSVGDENVTQSAVGNENKFTDQSGKSDSRKKMYICNNKLTETKLQKIYADNSKTHTFHYFEFANNGHLKWIQSKGDMSDLENYKSSNEHLTQESAVFSQFSNKINLITSDPGMGKSELMKSFKNKCPPEYWTVVITSKDVNSFLKSFSSSKTLNYLSLFQQFINKKYSSLKKLEKSFFELCLKQNHVLYVWDAIDEILSEYLHVALDIITQLSTKGFVQWITSRQHLQTLLEKKFNVLSYSLTQFSGKQQENYIKQRLNASNSAGEIETTIQKIKSTFVIIEHVDILGIPLQIFMLTELFRQNNEKYLQLLDNRFLLTDLYHSFIDEKFNIFYEHKIDYDLKNPHQANKIRQEKQKMLKHYEIFALKLVYPDFVLEQLNINYQKSVQKFSNNNYESIGIITELKNNVPHFLHGSFAEYLAGTYLSKNTRDIPVDVFFDQKYNNVRFFFDMLSGETSPAHVAVLYKNFDLLKSYDDKILACKDKGGRSALHLICSWGQRHPRVEISHESNGYNVELTPSLNGKPESKEYLDAVMYLQSKNNNSEHDSLLGLTPLLYARKCESLAAELQLLQEIEKNSILFQSYSSNDKINILYYSALLGYDNVVKLFGNEKFCISHGEINFVTMANQYTLLFLACVLGHKQIVQFLVKSGAEIDRADNHGFTPLYVASELGYEETVKYLVKSGAEINGCTKDGRTPFYAACYSGHTNIVEYLHQSGADINCADVDGHTPLRTASFSGHQKTVEYLVESGVEINRADNEGFTPLYRASQNGHEETVKCLVKSGAEINRCAKDGRTPLCAACESGHKNIAEYLHLSGADINCADVHGYTPLHTASFSGHQKTVEYLVESGVQINRADNEGFTPLYLASENGHEETVKYLVKSGAEINRCTKNGRTPLYAACRNGHKNIAEYLHLSGADLNCANVGGDTPLRMASFNGHQKIVEYLVESDVEINRADNEGFTPLYLASQNGHEETVKYLVKSGAEVNRSAKNGRTPLYAACRNGHKNIAEYLHLSGADINCADVHGYTPLHTASFSGHQKTVEYLVESGVEINRADNEGFTPLYLASENGHEETVKYLVKSGAEINRCTKNGRTPLYAACRNGHKNIAEYLHLSGADLNCANVGGDTPLRMASFNGHQKIVEYLVESDVEINRADNEDFTPLYVASGYGHEDTVIYLVKSGAEINRSAKNGRTPLHAACYSGNKIIVEYLHLSGADINCSDVDGYTPLCTASLSGHQKTVEYLVESGVEINRADNEGFTPLYVASGYGHEETVIYLVKSGAEINRSAKNGRTPLHAACYSGNKIIVEYLHLSGADINCSDVDGHTPLCTASLSGHQKTVEYLVESGVEINRADNEGFTPLYLASQNGHEETVKYLVKSGAEINRSAKNGRTPLYAACRNGHKNIAEYLHLSGADINCADVHGYTPLHTASFSGHQKTVEYLVESGVEINRADNEGFTPLYLASQNGHEETVKYLVKSGAEVNRSAKNGRTPLYAACRNGHKNIAEYLHLSGADINCADVHGYTPLHTASFSGHQKTVEYLVESGVEINRADNEGFTPLYSFPKWPRRNCQIPSEIRAEVNRSAKNGRTPLYAACRNGHKNIAEYFYRERISIAPMSTLLDGHEELSIPSEIRSLSSIALREILLVDILHGVYVVTAIIILPNTIGHQKTVEYLVESGVEINRADNEGFTPLHLASQNGHEETVKYLVKSGAEINRCAKDGRTPLYAACRNGHKNIAEYLHLSGADINCANVDGYTPLRTASFSGHQKTVEYLVESGVEINRADNKGITPLYLASQNGHEETVKYLVKSGAEINRSTNDRRTPLYAACRNGHKNIAEYLHLSGADINCAYVYGYTPLGTASFSGHQKTVEYLVESGVEINRADKEGFTPLYLASQNGHEESLHEKCQIPK